MGKCSVEAGSWLNALPAGDGPDDKEGLFPGGDRLRERGIRSLMRKIFLAGEEAQERPSLLRDVISDSPAQHRIAGLNRLEDRPLCGRALDLDRHLAADMGKRSQVLREYDADHGSVCTSTERTAGRSRTIGFQLSPASADA